MQPFLAAVLAALLTVPLGLPVHPTGGDDDAGSGGDAGDSPDAAYELPGPDVYAGSLSDSNDVDWYRLPATGSGPVCVSAVVTGSIYGQTSLQVVGSDVYVDADKMRPGDTVSMGFMLAAPEDLFFSVRPDDATVGGDYDFELQVYDLAELPGENADGDAGNSLETATPLPTGCFAGGLNSAEGDPADYFTFRGFDGQTFLFSLATLDNLELTLYDPAGQAVASASGTSVLEHTLEEAGTWTVGIVEGLTGAELTDPDLVYQTTGSGDNPCMPFCTTG